MESPKTEASLRRRATKTGTVTSDKMDKSVMVRVDRIILHPRYERYIKRSSKFMAHDAKNECQVGDTVEIVESRPLAARKRWRVRRIIRHAAGTTRPNTAAAD